MEIDQVYKAPSIPKLNRRNIKSTLISGAIKPGVELKKTKFSFIKPLSKLIPDSLVPIKEDESKREALVKYIQSNFGIQKVLEQSNKLLSQIKEQLSLDFLSRIREEKKDLEDAKKRIAAEKVKDKEKKIESGGVRGVLGKTFSGLLAPAKSIFQKLIDFFSIILTGILVNTAFKWLQKPENQEKLKQFFQFLKDYWKELLVVFGAIKLLGLVRKILKVANALKSLIDFFKKKPPQLPCKCPPSPAQNVDDCLPLKDCIDSLVKNPRRSGPMLEALASLIIATNAFEPVRKLLNQKPIQAPTPPSPQGATPPTLQQQYQRSRPGVPAGGYTPTNVRNAQRSASQQVPQTNQQKLINKRPWWDKFGMFGGGSRVVQEEQQIKRAEEASKVRPKNLNNLINLAKEEYKNNGEKEKVWKTSQEGWVVSYGRILTPTGEQNEFAKPEVRVYSPIQALKMSRTDPLLYAFLASNLPAIIGPVGAPKSTIGSQFSPRSQIYRGLRSPSSSSRQYLEPISPAEPPPPIIRPGRKITKSGSTRLTPEQLTRYQRSILETGGTATSKPTIDEFKQLLEMMFRAPTAVRAKGGTIPALFAGGGTVGGPGALGVDSVPAAIASGAGKLANYGKALLAPGEEVINTRASMLFRPLLKDINDNAARLWQSFTNAVRRQADVNAIKNGIIQELNKILGEFRELLDKESNDIKRKGRLRNTQTPPPGGGTLNSRRIPSSTSSPIKTSSQNIQPMKMPKVDMTVDNSKIVPQPQQKITPPQISTIEPKVTISNPIDITQKIVEPSIKVPFMEKTFVDNTKMYIVPVKETSSGAQKYEISKQKPSINYITLPTKTVNLGSTGSKPSAPSSSSGTSVPSISPIDQSNDYVFTTPSMYGILVV